MQGKQRPQLMLSVYMQGKQRLQLIVSVDMQRKQRLQLISSVYMQGEGEHFRIIEFQTTCLRLCDMNAHRSSINTYIYIYNTIYVKFKFLNK